MVFPLLRRFLSVQWSGLWLYGGWVRTSPSPGFSPVSALVDAKGSGLWMFMVLSYDGWLEFVWVVVQMLRRWVWWRSGVV